MLDGLQQVVDGEAVRVLQVGDRARNPRDRVVGACEPAERVHRFAQRGATTG